MRTGELLVRVARAVRAIRFPSLLYSRLKDIAGQWKAVDAY